MFDTAHQDSRQDTRQVTYNNKLYRDATLHDDSAQSQPPNPNISNLLDLQNRPALQPALQKDGRKLFAPTSIEALNTLLNTYPNATIWAGGTDLGLDITQRFIDYDTIIQLSEVDELKSYSLIDSPL